MNTTSALGIDIGVPAGTEGNEMALSRQTLLPRVKARGRLRSERRRFTPRQKTAQLTIRVLTLFSLSTVCLAGSAPKETTKQAVASASPPTFTGRVVELPKKVLRAGRDTITIAVDAPRGYHLTDEAPSSLCWYADNGKVVSFRRSCKSYKAGSIRFPFKLIIDAKPGQSNLTFDANVFYCEDKTKVCMFDKFRIKAPIEVNGRGPTSTTVSVELEVLDEKR